MTKRPSRTKLKLEDVPPKSVGKIFSFINILLNRYKLSVDWFKENIHKLNPLEVYFICKYCQLYFSNQGSGIYLYRWLEQQRDVYDDNDEPELFQKLDEQISHNQERLLRIIPFIQNVAKRRGKNLIRFDISPRKYANFYTDDTINSRIPLFYNKKKFKQMFYDIWLQLYTSNEVDEMYTNSFQFLDGNFPPKPLYLEIDKRMKVYRLIALTIKAYKDHVDRQTENWAQKYNEHLNTISQLRRDYLKKYNYESIIRLPFAYMMYNTFPEVRDKFYNKRLEQPDYSLDLYLENLFKNFSARN